MILRCGKHPDSARNNRLHRASIELLDSVELASAAFSADSRKCLHQVRDQEVSGSNPLAPTILFSTAYTLSPSEKVVGSKRGRQTIKQPLRIRGPRQWAEAFSARFPTRLVSTTYGFRE